MFVAEWQRGKLIRAHSSVPCRRFDTNGKNLRRMWLRTEQKARWHNDFDELCVVRLPQRHKDEKRHLFLLADQVIDQETSCREFNMPVVRCAHEIGSESGLRG